MEGTEKVILVLNRLINKEQKTSFSAPYFVFLSLIIRHFKC
jgi:hypothetical protein